MPERRRDLLVVCALFVTVVTVLSLGHAAPFATTLLLTLAAAGTLVVWNDRRDLMLGITGVLLGPAIEIAATSSGLWRYAAPSVGTVPLWIVPMWWIYAVTVPRLVGAWSRDALQPAPPLVAAAAIAIEVVWLCAFGVTQPAVACAGALMLLALVIGRHNRRADLITLVVCGAIGPAAEWIPVAAGAWSYADTRLFGMPIWLPPGYAVFGTLLIQLGVAWDQRRVPLETRLAKCA